MIFSIFFLVAVVAAVPPVIYLLSALIILCWTFKRLWNK